MEDVEHFLLGYSALKMCWEQLGYMLWRALPTLGLLGVELLGRSDAGLVGRLRVLMGDLSVEPVLDKGNKENHIRSAQAQTGKARCYIL